MLDVLTIFTDNAGVPSSNLGFGSKIKELQQCDSFFVP